MVSLDGKPLQSSEEYLQRERAYNSGAKLRFRVSRDRQEKEITVTAGRFPQEKADDLTWKLLGLAVAETKDGLEVKKVRSAGPAERIGFTRGDIILGIAGNQIKTLAEFRRKVIDARMSQGLLLSVSRGHNLYHITVPLDQG